MHRDSGALDGVVLRLLAAGYFEVANVLLATRKGVAGEVTGAVAGAA